MDEEDVRLPARAQIDQRSCSQGSGCKIEVAKASPMMQADPRPLRPAAWAGGGEGLRPPTLQDPATPSMHPFQNGMIPSVHPSRMNGWVDG